jgi:cytoskeletal protein RodZ
MKTAGSMLREARIAQGLTLSQVEHATKIRAKFLEGIEADDYSELPSVSYAKGFVKNYSEFLGLNSRTVLAFFRRQTPVVTKSSILPRAVHEPLNRSAFQLTPGRFLALLATSLVGLFLVYLGVQYVTLNRVPMLELESPQQQAVVADARIDVLGKTDPDATVTINGMSVLVRSDGKFFDQVTLEPGVNIITITATSRLGKTTTVTREVGLTQESF